MPPPKVAGSQRSSILGVTFYLCIQYTLYCRTAKFHMVTHGGLVFRWSAISPSQCCPIFGVPFYLCVHLLSQNYRIDLVAHVGSGMYLGGQPRLPSQESGVPALPNFGVLPYLCLRPLTKNDQIRHIITYEEGRVLVGQHKCVARFVCDC